MPLVLPRRVVPEGTMIPEARCEKCKYFKPENPAIGECTRFPPQLFMLMGRYSRKTKKRLAPDAPVEPDEFILPEKMSSWTIVNPNQWCGEWKPKVAA